MEKPDFDFTKKEDLERLTKACETLKENPFINTIINTIFGSETFLDDLKDAADVLSQSNKILGGDDEKKHDATNKNREIEIKVVGDENKKQFIKKEIDKSLRDVKGEIDESQEENEDCEELKRPSEITPIDAKLQIHKLVAEYVDEYIRPYTPKEKLDLINDVYAGLFEFGCWIFNK